MATNMFPKTIIFFTILTIFQGKFLFCGISCELCSGRSKWISSGTIKNAENYCEVWWNAARKNEEKQKID